MAGKEKRFEAPKSGCCEKEFAAKIAQVAYSLWEKRGHSHGSDMADWLEAEKLVRKELAKKSKSFSA